ncbi:TetR family transcriptional regulator [Nocardia vinacea]|uniref:TetR family transcriptional regulator n=1 Tax=Nocardia vinacea TaxID=96468 RepID=UPI0002EF0F94|nr:TetR family transcriptional regulator [Nocardia vinacea]
MSRTAARIPSKKIIKTVLALLQTDGYDAVQLREVARRAHVSLATVYKLFPTRDALIIAAVHEWMATNTYPDIAPPIPEESIGDGVIRILRHVFEPWERNPTMLEAFYRANSAPGGARLSIDGFATVLPVAAQIFEGADPDYIEDMTLILPNMVYALIGRVADKTLDVDEILPILERTVRRLTADNTAQDRAVRERRSATDQPEPLVLGPEVAAPFIYDRNADASAAAQDGAVPRPNAG